MHALMVIAHPCDDSFCHAAAATAVAAMERGGHTVDVIDLYADRFTTAMTRDERVAYHTESPILDEQVADYVERLQRAEALVFVYPTWWSGMPAILKGWLDRVLVYGVAFEFDERGRVRPKLGYIKRIVGISTYGSPRPAVMLVNDNGRRVFTRALRMSCGLRTRTRWLALYAMDSATDDDRRAFLDRISTTMESL
jgi:NAD(P)H dehydrogenase (quinone)